MDSIKEFEILLKNYSKDDIVFGKIEKYILDRINASKEEVIKELFSGENLKFVEKQERNNETRYALFFVYSKRKGRVYVAGLGEEFRIITAYPIGRKTLSKYKKKRFIN
ncbi:hypothetical protein HY449_00685 [Candidatus Pacearchaeota archaeon]|nr:hypothetical protein [Candidatus Pacearchaeota archaeon]